MQEKNNEEYQTFIHYRDYWAEELTGCISKETELEEQSCRLAQVQTRIREQAEQISRILSGLLALPDSCSLWEGARAMDAYLQCTEGTLYQAFHRMLLQAEALLEKMEEKLQEIRSRLEAVCSDRMSADYYYRLWSQRVSAYWY